MLNSYALAFAANHDFDTIHNRGSHQHAVSQVPLHLVLFYFVSSLGVVHFITTMQRYLDAARLIGVEIPPGTSCEKWIKSGPW